MDGPAMAISLDPGYRGRYACIESLWIDRIDFLGERGWNRSNRA
jgi:hypothetical protein